MDHQCFPEPPSPQSVLPPDYTCPECSTVWTAEPTDKAYDFERNDARVDYVWVPTG
jgi:hypothetical protein